MAETGIQQIEMIGYKVVHQDKWNCLLDDCMSTEILDEHTIMHHMIFGHGIPLEKLEFDKKDGSVWLQGCLEKLNEGQVIN